MEKNIKMKIKQTQSKNAIKDARGKERRRHRNRENRKRK